MKAWLFLSIWLGVGLMVGLRRSAPPWERLLAVLFWPFFLVGEGGPPPAEGDPLDRLRRALGDDEQAGLLLVRLERAMALQTDRIRRLERELLSLRQVRGGEPALVESRARSMAAVEGALAAERRAWAQTLARIDEQATRLVLLAEEGRQAAVGALIADLVGLLEARSEVELSR